MNLDYQRYLLEGDTYTDLTFREFVSFYVLKFLQTRHLIDFAMLQLDRYEDSDSLVSIVIQENPIMYETSAFFDTFLHEISFDKPDRLEAQLVVAQYYAHAILNGRVTPYQGAHALWLNICDDLAHPSTLLRSMAGAASELEDLPIRFAGSEMSPDPYIQNFEEEIKEGAKALIHLQGAAELCES